MNLIKIAIGRHLAFLCKQAEQGNDIDTYVNFTLDQIPEAHLPKLVELISGENPLQTLIQACPDVAKHQTWFVMFIEALKETLQPEPEPAINSTHADTQDTGHIETAKPD